MKVPCNTVKQLIDGFLNTDEVKAILFLKVFPTFTTFPTNPEKESTKDYLATVSVVKIGGLKATLSLE
jgi:hypothetical protein